MEISNDLRPIKAQPRTPENENTKAVKEQLPAEGETIKAEITDIKQDKITVKLDNGQTISAKLAGTVQSQIGDEAVFVVRYDKGAIVLEPKTVESELVQKNLLSDLLKSYNLKPTSENLKIMEELLKNSIPLTQESYAKFNQALKLTGNDFSKAVFMLNNNIKLNTKNAGALNSLTDSAVKLNSQLNSIFEAISALDDIPLKNALAELLKGTAQSRQTNVNGESGSGVQNGTSGQTNVNGQTGSDMRTGTNGQTGVSAQASSDMQTGTSGRASVSGQTSSAMQTETNGQSSISGQTTSSVQTGIKPTLNSQPLSSFDKGSTGSTGAAIKQMDAAGELAVKTLAETLSGSHDGLSETRTARDFRENFESILKELSLDNDSKEVFSPETFKKLTEAVLKEAFSAERLTTKKTLFNDKPKTIAEKQRIIFDFENASPDEIDKFLNELNENINKAKDLLQNSQSTPEKANLLKEMNNVNENLNFISNLKNTIFVQLPIIINDKDTNLDLFVFKDKKKRSQSKTKSALIALDTANIGHFETYILKTDNNINFQFRIEDKYDGLLRENIPRLNEMLQKYNYKLDGYTIKKLEENFTLLEQEPSLHPEHNSQLKEEGARRINFDIRA